MAANIVPLNPPEPEMIEIKEEFIEPMEIKTEPVDEDWELPFLNRDGLKQVNVREEAHLEISEDPCVASASTVTQVVTRIKTEPTSDPLAPDGHVPSKEELLYGNACSINPLLEDEKIDGVKCEPSVLDDDFVGSEILRELLLMPIPPSSKEQADTLLRTKKMLKRPASERLLPPDFSHLSSPNVGGLVQSGAGSAMCVIPRDVGLRYIGPAKAAVDSPPPGEATPATENAALNGGKRKNTHNTHKVMSEQERLKHVKNHLIRELKKLKRNQLRERHERVSHDEGINHDLETKRHKSHKKIIRSLRKNFRKELLHRTTLKLYGENNKESPSATQTVVLPAREKTTRHTDTGNLTHKEDLRKILLNRITQETSKSRIRDAQIHIIQNHAKPKYHTEQIKDEHNRITQEISKPRIGDARDDIVQNHAKPKFHKKQIEDDQNRIILKRIEQGNSKPQVKREQDHNVQNRAKCKFRRKVQVIDGISIHNFPILKFRKGEIEGEDCGGVQNLARAQYSKQQTEEKQEQRDGKSTESVPKQPWIGSFWGCSLCKDTHFFSSAALSKHKVNFHPNDTMLAYFVSSVSSSSTTQEQKVTTSNISCEGTTQVGEYALTGDNGGCDLPDDLRTLIVDKIAALARAEEHTPERLSFRNFRRNPPNSSSICEFCGKVFSHLGDCNKHRRSHTGERPHVCNVGGCKTSFATHSNLSRHRKLHLGVKYRCAMCDAAYSRRDKLVSHSKVCRRSLVANVNVGADEYGDDEIVVNAVGPSVLTASEVLKLGGAADGQSGVVFLCQTCKETFTNVWEFIEHRDRHAAGSPEPPSEEDLVANTNEPQEPPVVTSVSAADDSSCVPVEQGPQFIKAQPSC